MIAIFLKIFMLIVSIFTAIGLWVILKECGSYIFIILAAIVIYNILT